MAKGVKTGGRKKGTPNKLTASVKDAFHAAFGELQEQPSVRLVDWAKANPTEFYKLAARLIPAEVQGNVDGVVKVIHETA